MSGYTEHFGLQTLNVGDQISEASYRFSDADRRLIDRFLWKLSSRSYSGSNPGSAPTLGLSTSGGTLPAGAQIYYVYTLVDQDGLETAPSPVASRSTASSILSPVAPSLMVLPTGGSLLPGQYFYALSAYKGANTSETKVSASAQATVQGPGSTSRVSLTMPTLPTGATGFNIYRRAPGDAQYAYLASTTSLSYIDAGTVANNNRSLPLSNTTTSTNQITVTIPSLPQGMTWKIYRTFISGQWQNSLLHWVVEETTENSGVIRTNWVDVGGGTTASQPPPKNQQIGAAASGGGQGITWDGGAGGAATAVTYDGSDRRSVADWAADPELRANPELRRLDAETVHALTVLPVPAVSAGAVGLARGSKSTRVGELRSYLARFGYLAAEPSKVLLLAEQDVEFDDETERALRNYQRFHRLKVTGVLDEPTVRMMSLPRCGVPDVASGERRLGFNPGPTGAWSRRNLTYGWEAHTGDITVSSEEAAFADALSKWATVPGVGLVFTKVAPNWASGAAPDIVIGVSSTMPAGTIAWASYPEASDIEFNYEVSWRVAPNVGPADMDYTQTAMHELGHALGLAHSDVQAAVMWSGLTQGQNLAHVLHADDIAGIQYLYPDVTPPPPVTNLSAVALSSSSIQITWTAAPRATSYKILSENASGQWPVVGTTTTQTGFVHTGLPPSTFKKYGVEAHSSAGFSVSSVVSATTHAAAPPPSALFPNLFEALPRAASRTEADGPSLRQKMVATTDPVAAMAEKLQRIHVGVTPFNVAGQSNWVPDAANNDAAVLSAITAAVNAGGGTVLLPRLLKIVARIVVPHQVDLVGLGALPGSFAMSKILCTAAGSGVSFGTDAAGSGGGISGGFQIDGNGVALNPMRCAVGTRTYQNIEIQGAVEDGLICAATQNSLYAQVNIGGSGRDNLVLDMGAGGNHFLKCENHTPQRSHIAFRASVVGGGGVAFPLQNVFQNNILEYTETNAGPMIQHGAGQLNAFLNCQVVSGNGLTTMATPAMIRIAKDYTISSVVQPSQMIVEDGTIVTTTAQSALRAFDIGAGASLYIGGLTSVSGMGICYKTAATAIVEEYGRVIFPGATRVEGTESAVSRTFLSRLAMTRGAAELALQVYQPGDTVARYSLYGNGLAWYSAGNAAIDVDWGRKGAGLVGTGGKVVATGGIGVGNSVAATTPGSVVGKTEVFNAAGVSLGFMPIYNNIT